MVSTPARCPAIAGRCRCRAQRRLPSMTIATCRGTSTSLDAEDLLLLGLADLVDLEDVPVGQLLELLLEALELVGGDPAVLLLLAHLVVGVAPQGADLDTALFHLLVQHPDEVAAALFGQRRDRQPDDRPVVARGEAEVAREDRLLDRPDEKIG